MSMTGAAVYKPVDHVDGSVEYFARGYEQRGAKMVVCVRMTAVAVESEG